MNIYIPVLAYVNFLIFKTLCKENVRFQIPEAPWHYYILKVLISKSRGVLSFLHFYQTWREWHLSPNTTWRMSLLEICL